MIDVSLHLSIDSVETGRESRRERERERERERSTRRQVD